MVEIEGTGATRFENGKTVTIAGTVEVGGKAYKFFAARTIYTDDQENRVGVSFRSIPKGQSIQGHSKLPKHREAVLADPRVRERLELEGLPL